MTRIDVSDTTMSAPYRIASNIAFATTVFPLLATPAFAQTVVASPPSTTTVFIGNALEIMLVACVPPVAAILSGALWKLWTKWGFQATAQDKANMDDELQKALAFGVSQALPAIKAHGWDSLDVHNQVVAQAAKYFLQRFPERTATITASAGTATPTAAVSQTLATRLPEAIAVAAASPATPPSDSTSTSAVPKGPMLISS